MKDIEQEVLAVFCGNPIETSPKDEMGQQHFVHDHSRIVVVSDAGLMRMRFKIAIHHFVQGEIVDAGFFSLDDFPGEIPPFYEEVLDGLRSYDGTLIVS